MSDIKYRLCEIKINKHKGTSLTGSVSMATASAVTPFVVISHIPETK
jgi:hypothetical protein